MDSQKLEQELLELLQKDAKITAQQAAAMLGCSEEETKEKIKELEQAGIIRKYKALINWERAPGDERIFALIEVKVAPERDVGFDATARRIYNFPEVSCVYLVSGDYDLAVIVEGKNMKEVAAFVAEKLAPIERVQSTVTHFVLKTYKKDGEILAEEPPSVDRREAIML